MTTTNYLSVIDDVCKLYHPSLHFPISLDNVSNDKNTYNLIQIGSSLDYELSTSHLSRHDILLIISNGSNGKELINYLYKELVFVNISEDTNNEYYYVCPYRSPSDYNINTLQFLTKNLNNAERDKINDIINTIKVVTEESNMNMISIFLAQISKTSPLSGTNALIDSLVQNKANKILMILNSNIIENNEILYYEDIIKSIIESGYIRKLELFINFNNQNDQLGQEDLNNHRMKLLNEFNNRLHNLFQNEECYDIIKGLKYDSICIPSDVRLIEHLLGVQPNKLESFSNYLTHLNGSIEELSTTESGTQATRSSNGPKDEGIGQMNSILNNINSLKINYSINRLENDLKSLININNRYCRLILSNRNRKRTNNLITFLNYYKEFQNYAIIFLIVFTLFLHLLTSYFFNNLLMRLKINNFNIPNGLKNLVNRYGLQPWFTFYLFLIAFYYTFDFVCNKFLLKREFDNNKYIQQKHFSKHLNDIKHRLNDIQRNVT